MKIRINRLKIKPILAMLLALTWHSSCNDWLDIEPENELILQEFWKTSDDVMSVMAATYDALRGCTEKSFLLGEVRGDYILTRSNAYSDYIRIGVSDITSTNDKVRWGEYYNTINLANTVMHFAPLVQELDKTLTNDVLKRINSEMLFIRSLSYFYLVRLWKDVPLVLNPTISDTVNFYLPKSPEHVIIDQLIVDLKKASALASANRNEDSGNIPYQGRATKYAIQALLADVLLWDENYEESAAYCDSIIASGHYELETTIDWFYLYYPGNSPIESLFEIQYDDRLEAQENPMYEVLYNSLGIRSSLMAFDEDNDIRFCRGYGGLWKYRVMENVTGRPRPENERDANYVYYRYSEVLLMKAEALAELGNFEEANYLVRLVAERAGVTHNSIYDLKDFRSALLIERGKEFSAEGKRWFDVLRFAKRNNFENKKLVMDIILGKATDANELAILQTKVIDTMSYYLPIHEDELQYNRNLVQNPFYDR